MDVAALAGVEAVSEEEWSTLADRQWLFESRHWLLANERRFVGEPLVTVERGCDGLRSLVVWRTTAASVASPYHNILALLRRFGRVPSNNGQEGWTLNCTGSGMHSPVLCAPGVTVTPQMLGAHIRAAIMTQSTTPAAVGFPFVPEHGGVAGLTESLADLGFSACSDYTRALLDLPGDSFDDYLGRLSAGRRKTVRQDRRQFAFSGLHTAIMTGSAANGEDLLRLQGLNLAKYNLPFDPDPQRERIRALLAACGENSLVIRSLDGKTTTGFVAFFWLGDTAHAVFGGFDPNYDRRGAYFECLFYTAIEWAYDHGVRLIDFGLSATIANTRAKERRGCRIGPNLSWSCLDLRADQDAP